MSKTIRIPDELAEALEATVEGQEHGRSYAGARLIAMALGEEPPATPNERRRENAVEHGVAGAEARWGKK